MTPAQQVSWARDVPASCACEQVWRGERWVQGVPHPGCPWHAGRPSRCGTARDTAAQRGARRQVLRQALDGVIS